MVDETANFAVPSKLGSCPESPDSPRITTGQQVIWKRGVLHSGFAWHEWFPRTPRESKSNQEKLGGEHSEMTEERNMRQIIFPNLTVSVQIKVRILSLLRGGCPGALGICLSESRAEPRCRIQYTFARPKRNGRRILFSP
jgi:hypothetical protein